VFSCCLSIQSLLLKQAVKLFTDCYIHNMMLNVLTQLIHGCYQQRGLFLTKHSSDIRNKIMAVKDVFKFCESEDSKCGEQIFLCFKLNHMVGEKQKNNKTNQSNHWLVFSNLITKKVTFNTDVEQSDFLFTCFILHSDFYQLVITSSAVS